MEELFCSLNASSELEIWNGLLVCLSNKTFMTFHHAQKFMHCQRFYIKGTTVCEFDHLGLTNIKRDNIYTECPTHLLTTSDSILYFLKTHYCRTGATITRS